MTHRGSRLITHFQLNKQLARMRLLWQTAGYASAEEWYAARPLDGAFFQRRALIAICWLDYRLRKVHEDDYPGRLSGSTLVSLDCFGGRD